MKINEINIERLPDPEYMNQVHQETLGEMADIVDSLEDGITKNLLTGLATKFSLLLGFGCASYINTPFPLEPSKEGMEVVRRIGKVVNETIRTFNDPLTRIK